MRAISISVSVTAAVVAAAALAAGAADAASPSGDPYQASVANRKCMRANGGPEPMPDRRGDIHLTLAQERRLRAVGKKNVDAADRICFRNLRAAFSTKPLSATAIAQAKVVLGQLKGCVDRFGFTMGTPKVKNMSEGRAF